MVNGKTEKNMDLGDIPLPILISMKDSLWKVIDLEKVNIHGLMEAFMMVNGREIK